MRLVDELLFFFLFEGFIPADWENPMVFRRSWSGVSGDADSFRPQRSFVSCRHSFSIFVAICALADAPLVTRFRCENSRVVGRAIVESGYSDLHALEIELPVRPGELVAAHRRRRGQRPRQAGPSSPLLRNYTQSCYSARADRASSH